MNRERYEVIIDEIQQNDISNISLRDKYTYLKKILERNCKELTTGETLQFPSLFSRLVYLTQKYNIAPSLEWKLQNIRVKSAFLQKNESNLVSPGQYDKAKDAIREFFSIIYLNQKTTTPEEDTHSETHVNSSVKYLRVQITDLDPEEKLIIGICENTISEINIKYGVENINDTFNPTIERLWIGAQLNIIDSYLDKSGYYIPKYIVLEPDYLIDASAMAECFQNYSKSYLHYFRKRFEPPVSSHYILLGNLANFFLDELIFASHPDEVTFDQCFLKAFRDKPFEFTSCNDIKQPSDFRAFMSKAHTQFENIKRCIKEDFPANHINVNDCTLEPSFYCEQYGFQGRLDLLQLAQNSSDTTKIVELKSGGVPFPKNDPSKIAVNHEVQTAIYRLIIKSVFGFDDRKISSAILYSAAENRGENLRLAVPYQKLEKEIINLRNLIIATEHDIYTGGTGAVDQLFLNICNLDNYGKVPDFFTQQIIEFEKTIKNISETERLYLYRFIAFITRELYIQKIGDNYFESNSSTASLWNTEYLDRLESFDLIPDLEIIDIDDSSRDMKILFKRSGNTDFVNFREGEVCILYPHEKDEDSALTNQILKGTIAEISIDHLLLRFRYKQKNKTFFNSHKNWVVEHDRLDHSYTNMYKSLFSFIKSPIDKRQLLLGVKEPQYFESKFITHVNTPQEEKREIVIQKAINAKDYFLIVGPPGTGKTSIFARRLIEYYYNNTTQNILIIAYTNRAVDELCESINQAFGHDNQECDKYIRIGTELSCHENYRHRLLQNIASEAKSREELRKTIHTQRIFIGTLASVVGRQEIFDLKQFNLAIIDEASQILEPQIVGILPKVDKFIMIGDHKQLSTITLQDEEKSKVEDQLLNIIKLYNCRESLFERLFRINKDNRWEHAYDTLVYQGRMHNDLMEFPNFHFYEDQLKIANNWQSENLSEIILPEENLNTYQNIISSKRRYFFNCSEIFNSQSDKINYAEAEIITDLAKAILNIYNINQKRFDPEKTIGIITPYRNQIALIKHKLKETQIPELQNIMIDTVERFQGSQRDIILLSFCMNRPYQLDFFSNLNSEKTVDRKLNVAITRARSQFFAVGNEYILSQNPIYRKFLDFLG
ncbi:AAA domain-containing protein [Dysgonomonas macrotermitis]|uniref:DNA replication ATP-dependent helicase Dna2 n=1 Tax=Dysgonomonas macrotermitis TaxID=1346286 RepID=A0A1M5AHH2_9BACT|nr:AAA domain-containing protein [Dysgonomonas macrotermitis]SHF29739.1 DNA replication ATP-dependent helicase Dna2 [Dysgonomonas macrotermitis]